jgi:hypothetical protein
LLHILALDTLDSKFFVKIKSTNKKPCIRRVFNTWLYLIDNNQN